MLFSFTELLKAMGRADLVVVVGGEHQAFCLIVG